MGLLDRTVRSRRTRLAAVLGVFALVAMTAQLPSAAAQEGADYDADADIVDAHDGNIGDDEMAAGDAADMDVGADGEAAAAAEAQAAEEGGRMPRDVFEALIARSSPTCQEELNTLANTQGKTPMSDECTAEATATMQSMQAEGAQQQRAQQQQQQQQQQQPAAAARDGSTEALIVLAFAGAVFVAIAGYITVQFNTIKAKEAAEAPDRAAEAARQAKRDRKRQRKGKPPVQNSVDIM